MKDSHPRHLKTNAWCTLQDSQYKSEEHIYGCLRLFFFQSLLVAIECLTFPCAYILCEVKSAFFLHCCMKINKDLLR